MLTLYCSLLSIKLYLKLQWRYLNLKVFIAKKMLMISDPLASYSPFAGGDLDLMLMDADSLRWYWLKVGVAVEIS